MMQRCSLRKIIQEYRGERPASAAVCSRESREVIGALASPARWCFGIVAFLPQTSEMVRSSASASSPSSAPCYTPVGSWQCLGVPGPPALCLAATFAGLR